MTDTKVMIGCTYIATKYFTINGEEVKQGTELYAWYCGYLIMVKTIDGRLTNKEYPIKHNSWIIKLIDNGTLILK